MATLTRNTMTTGGLFLESVLVAADVSLADEVNNNVSNNTRTFIAVQNGGGSPITVTLNSAVNCSQGFDHDSVVTVDASETQLIGPLPKSRWNDSAGLVQWTYSDVTSVTVAVIELP